MKKAVVIDVDGTIADHRARKDYCDLHASNGSQTWWEHFMDGENQYEMDEPVKGVVWWLRHLQDEGYTLLYVTARRSSTEGFLKVWMAENRMPAGILRCRPQGENGLEWKVKTIAALAEHYQVVAGYGDRQQDWEAYGRLGLQVFQVNADGEGWDLPNW